MIDYASLDSAIGHNWYDLDPDLQARVRRDCPPEDFEWADAKLREFGGLVGERVAPNSEVVDAHPPVLRRYDQWAEEVNEIVHHPAAVDSKRALWASGYVGGFARDEADRGRPPPGVMLAATSYLLSQADTGLVCSLGMTSGVAGLVAAYAPPDVRDALLPGLRGDSFDGGVDGSMFLTERDGGSDLGRTVHCTARDVGDGRVVINGEKWFCSNIDGAAIVMLARPEGAPDGPAGLGLYLVPKEREDGSRNGISMRRLKPKLGTKSVPTGEVEFHDALGYALRSTRSRDGGGLRRILVPATKVRLCRFGVEAASKAVELHGGNGYCEDWPLTRQLRDAQCHPIWEGTEQICQLDVLRAIRRDTAHEAALARIDRAIDAAVAGPEYVADAVAAVSAARDELERRVDELPSLDADLAEARAARITTQLARTVSAALLLEQSAEDPHKALVGVRFTRRNLSPVAAWDDRVAMVAGRELLAHDEIDHATAEKAAA